jgi:hypothetical protein
MKVKVMQANNNTASRPGRFRPKAEPPHDLNATDLRKKLCAGGYSPIPVISNTKRPPMDGWQTKIDASDDEIELWSKLYPHAQSTGLITTHTPTLDIDIPNDEAAKAVEDLVREHFDGRKGCILVRFGRAPKRAIPFRTVKPFKKITVNLIAPNGSGSEKLEFLGDGQQLVAFGIHPDTGEPYRWFGGAPGEVKHYELPYLSEAEARQLVEDAAALLCREFGYKRGVERPCKGNGENGDVGGGAADWGYLADNIHKGRELHDSLVALSAKLLTSGTDAGSVVNFLRGLMEKAECPHDERWQARYKDIPRIVASFEKKQEAQAANEAAPKLEPWTIERTLKVFDKWLILNDLTPVYAVLGTVAANQLPGDPIWLGLVGPPSSAKTELLNSTLLLPHVVPAATLTPAGLLSGTPKAQHHKGAKGGLLCEIGPFGIIVLKDFGSILSMRPDAKAEVLAALREVYDGAWTRHLGTEGGKTYSWQGKVGLLFGVTGVIDSHYGLIGAMGDRYLLSRVVPVERGQFERALAHMGAASKQMREELAEAVAHLFAGERREPQKLTDAEARQIDGIISLVVRLRGAVERDHRTREMEAVLGAEGVARIGLTLERLLAGLDTLGVERAQALRVVESIAMDSVPPLRGAPMSICAGACWPMESTRQ